MSEYRLPKRLLLDIMSGEVFDADDIITPEETYRVGLISTAEQVIDHNVRVSYVTPLEPCDLARGFMEVRLNLQIVMLAPKLTGDVGSER